MALLRKDLTGTYVGSLYVIEEFLCHLTKKSGARWTRRKLKVRCKCGVIFYPFKSNVVSKKTCGCVMCANSGVPLDQKIGNLLVLRRDLDETRSFMCLCDCGNEESIRSHYLRKGKPPLRCSRCRHPKKYLPKRTREEFQKENARRKHELSLKKLMEDNSFNVKVLGFSHWEDTKNRRRAWYFVKCKCGKKFTVRNDWIKNVKGCGCNRYLREKDSVSLSANLSAQDVKAIRAMIKSKMYIGRKLAKMFGVSECTISSIKKNQSYKNVV